MEVAKHTVTTGETYDAIGSVSADSPPSIKWLAGWLKPEAWEKSCPVPNLDTVEKTMQERGWQPHMLHSALIPNISYAVPCYEVIETTLSVLSKHKTGKLIEIGAGLGFLSALFQRAGVDVTATEISPSGTLRHTNIVALSAQQAMDLYPDHAVLMSWPHPSQTVARETSNLSSLSVQAPLYGGGHSMGHFNQNNGYAGEMAQSFQPPSLVGLTVLNKLRAGNFLFYIHGDDRHPWNNEPSLLREMRKACLQVTEDIPLPKICASDSFGKMEQSFLRVFIKN